MDVVLLVLIILAVLCCVIGTLLWIPLTGYAPKRALQVWTHIMRSTKCGDQYEWSWNQVEDMIYIGTLPRFTHDLIELRDQETVGAIVTMNETWELVLPQTEVESLGLTNLVVGTPDYSAPSLRKVKMCVEFSMEALNRGKGVYVHCNAGRGRSCVVVVCLLILRYRMEALEAYEFVARKRRVAKLPHLCQTKPQWRVIKEFEAWLHTEGAAQAEWLKCSVDVAQIQCKVNPLQGIDRGSPPCSEEAEAVMGVDHVLDVDAGPHKDQGEAEQETLPLTGEAEQETMPLTGEAETARLREQAVEELNSVKLGLSSASTL